MEQIIKALEGKLEEEEQLIVKTEPAIIEDKKIEVVIETDTKIEEQKIESVSENGLNFKRFNFKDDSSDKFWEIAQDGVRMVVRYGKVGTKGQENVKVFETEIQTKTEIDKLIQQKIKKGYQV